METSAKKGMGKMILLTAGAVAIGFVIGRLAGNHMEKHLPAVLTGKPEKPETPAAPGTGKV